MRDKKLETSGKYALVDLKLNTKCMSQFELAFKGYSRSCFILFFFKNHLFLLKRQISRQKESQEPGTSSVLMWVQCPRP